MKILLWFMGGVLFVIGMLVWGGLSARNEGKADEALRKKANEMGTSLEGLKESLNHKDRIFLIIDLIGAVVLMLLGHFSTDMNPMIVFGLVITVFLILVLIANIGKYKDNQKIKRGKSFALKYLQFDEDKGLLTIEKKGAELSGIISIVSNKDKYIQTTPKKLHYGSVTVGGITTGGIYETGGKDYIATGLEDGTCNLGYDGIVIQTIQLSDELYTEAQKSDIKKYVNEETKQIKLVYKKYMSEMDKVEMLSKLQVGYVGNNLHYEYPSIEKGNKIYAWLTSNN